MDDQKVSYRVPKRSISYGVNWNEMDIVRQKLFHDYDLRDKYMVCKKPKSFNGMTLRKSKILFKGTYKQCFEYIYNNGNFIGSW